jgi:hypothetical protein
VVSQESLFFVSCGGLLAKEKEEELELLLFFKERTMRTLSLFVVTIILAPALSWACMPPPPGTLALTIQSQSLNKALSDQAVISEVGQAVILTISFSPVLRFELADGCQFEVVPDASNASPGTCTQFLPLKIVNKTCAQ